MPWYNGWWIFPIVMPVVMIVVAVVMLMIIRSLFGGRGPWSSVYPSEPAGDQALEILRRRFASGEITEQEYEEKRQILAH